MREPGQGTTEALPETPLDVFALQGLEGIAAEALLSVARRTPLWRYPRRASGDFETMTFLDKVYWLYKCNRPMARPRRGSGLEAYFARQTLDAARTPAELAVGSTASLAAAGDLIHHPWLGRSEGALYERVADRLFDADVCMANLECPVVETDDALRFQMHEAPSLSLSQREFDVVRRHGERQLGLLATANNHSLDYGAEGADATRAALDAAGIAHHGTNATEDAAERARVVEANGIRIAVLSWTFGLNGHHPPPDRPWLVNRCQLNAAPPDAELARLRRQLDDARRHADFVVAQLHWGLEHELYPTPEQVELAHHLAELGVDAIVGHHPHVVQPAELYRTRRDPARLVPVWYSLGNLVNGFSAAHLTRGLVARLELAKGTARDGSTRTYVRDASSTGVRQRADADTRTIALHPV